MPYHVVVELQYSMRGMPSLHLSGHHLDKPILLQFVVHHWQQTVAHHRGLNQMHQSVANIVVMDNIVPPVAVHNVREAYPLVN